MALYLHPNSVLPLQMPETIALSRRQPRDAGPVVTDIQQQVLDHCPHITNDPT